MKVPDKKALGTGLRKWRNHHKWKVPEIAASSKNVSEKPISANLLYKWEEGTLTPSYDRLVKDVLPAYGIDNLHKMVVFLASFCQGEPEMGADIKLIKKDELSSNTALGIAIFYAEEDDIKPHPVRIDRMEVKAGKQSKITAHPGYNYLLVIDGSVQCSFWSNRKRAEGKASNPDRVVKLGKGDAVAFPTDLPHKIEATKEAHAHVVIARSSWGTPSAVNV
jgi:quercetin dioxygenase-like cupin family protein